MFSNKLECSAPKRNVQCQTEISVAKNVFVLLGDALVPELQIARKGFQNVQNGKCDSHTWSKFALWSRARCAVCFPKVQVKGFAFKTSIFLWIWEATATKKRTLCVQIIQNKICKMFGGFFKSKQQKFPLWYFFVFLSICLFCVVLYPELEMRPESRQNFMNEPCSQFDCSSYNCVSTHVLDDDINSCIMIALITQWLIKLVC